MVLEGQISRILNKVLGNKLYGLERENLKLSLLNGEVGLTNVRVKQRALDGSGLPIKVKAGYIGEIRIKVPWRDLGSRPVEVTIDRLHVLCEFKEDDDDDDDDARTEQDLTMNDDEEMKYEKKELRKEEEAIEKKKKKKMRANEMKKRRLAEQLERSWLKGDPTPGVEELTQKFWGDIQQTIEEEVEEEEEDSDDDDDDENYDDDDDDDDNKNHEKTEEEEKDGFTVRKNDVINDDTPDTKRRKEMFATPERRAPLQTPEQDNKSSSSATTSKHRRRSKSKGKKKPVGFEALLDVILANVVINVKNIHFRFEGEGDDNMPKFAVGASLESFTLETTNALGDSRAFIVDAFKDTLRKKLEINEASVYCDLNSVHLLDKPENIDFQPHEDPIRFCELMEACAKSKSRNRVIEPFAATAKYERAGLESVETGTAQALHGLHLKIPKTSANISAGAATLAHWAAKVMMKISRSKRFQHLRPGVSVFDRYNKQKGHQFPTMTTPRRINENAQLWWRYACNATVEEIRERRERLGIGFSLDSKTLKTLHKQRKAYVKLYINEILEKSAPPPTSKSANNWPMKKPLGKISTLDDLEREIPNARMIAFFRQLAHIEWRKNGGCERAFRREAIRRGGGPIPMKILKFVGGIAGKGLLIGMKVVNNVGFKPLGVGGKFIQNIGKTKKRSRAELELIKKREIEEVRTRAQKDDDNLKKEIREIRRRNNAATPAKHLFQTPLRNDTSDDFNSGGDISEDESQMDWDEVYDTFEINARRKYTLQQQHNMRVSERKKNIPMFAICIAFEEISMKILDASSHERYDQDVFSYRSSKKTAHEREKELFVISIKNVIVGAKVMGKSFVKDAIDLRSTIDTIRFSAPEGDLLALGQEEQDAYSSYTNRSIGFPLQLMLAKLFSPDLNDAEDAITNGRPRCFNGGQVTRAVSISVSKKRKSSKSEDVYMSTEEKEVGCGAIIVSPMFITILRGPIDRVVDAFTTRMKNSLVQSRLDSPARSTPALDFDVVPNVSLNSGSSASNISLPNIGLALFVGKVHLAIPSKQLNRKKKGTTLIARFGPLTARTLKKAQNAHVQHQDASARKTWRKKTIEGKLHGCSVGFADNFLWTCNHSWLLLDEAGKSERVETPLLSRVQCTILASYYALSPREVLKYSPLIVDVNLPSIQLSVSPERINMGLRVATQFTETAKKIAAEKKRMQDEKNLRDEQKSYPTSPTKNDQSENTFARLPSNRIGHKECDDIFTQDIDIFKCQRLVAATSFGEPPYWEFCDVSVRDGILSVIDKPKGSAHHLEPRILKMAGTRGAGNPLERVQEKVELKLSNIDERKKIVKARLIVSVDEEERLRLKNGGNREYSEYERTLIIGEALLDRSVESNFEKMCEHQNGFVLKFDTKSTCDLMKTRLNMEARQLQFTQVSKVLKTDEHKARKALLTFSMGLFGFHLAAPLRHHNHETHSYVSDMSKSYFIDELVDDEKVKYVIDCFQERPLVNVKVSGLTVSCEATRGSITLGAGLRRVAIKDCWTIEGINQDHDAVFIEKPLRDQISTHYLRYKTEAMKKSCIGFSVEAFLPSHPEFEKQTVDLRMAVSSLEAHVTKEPIAAFTSFRFLFRSPMKVGTGWPARYDDSVFAPSLEEWNNMREKLQKVKLIDATRLKHKIKLNFTFQGDSLIAKLYDDPKRSALAFDHKRRPILEACVSNFSSRLHERIKPVGRQGWGGGKQGTKDLEILCENLTLSDPTKAHGHANRDLISKDNAASDFSTFFTNDETAARNTIKNIPFLWIRRQTWLPHEHEDDIDIELEAKVAPLRVIANQNCIINIANCLLPIFKTLSPPHFAPNLPPFVLPRPGFVTKKVKITAHVSGLRIVLPSSMQDELAPSLSICVGCVDKNSTTAPFKGIDISTSFSIDASRAHWARIDCFSHGLSLMCKKNNSHTSTSMVRSSPLLRASGPNISQSDVPVTLNAICWNRLDARRQLSNAPSLDVNVQIPDEEILTIDISASDVETLTCIFKGYAQTSTMTYTQTPFAFCYLTPAKYPPAPLPPKKDFLIHQCFQARINHVKIGLFGGKGRSSQIVEMGIRGISIGSIANPRNQLRSELAVGIDGLYVKDVRFKGHKIDLVRAGFCDEENAYISDGKLLKDQEAVDSFEDLEVDGNGYLQSMFLNMTQVTTREISEVDCQCSRIAIAASIDSMLEAARVFQPKLGAGENLMPQDISIEDENKMFRLRGNVTLSRTKRILADFPSSANNVHSQYILDGCGHTILLDYSDKIYFHGDFDEEKNRDNTSTNASASNQSNSDFGNRDNYLTEHELRNAPRVIVGPNRRLIIKNCQIVCPNKEMFELSIRMAAGGSYFFDSESVRFLTHRQMMIEKTDLRKRSNLSSINDDSFSESNSNIFSSSFSDKEMKFLMDSWRARVKTIVAILRNLRAKPGYAISSKKRIDGARAIIGLKGNDQLGDVLFEVQKEAVLKVVEKQRKKSSLKCILKLHAIDVAIFPSRDPDEGVCASLSVTSKIDIIGTNVESFFELEHFSVTFPDSSGLNPLVEPCRIKATLGSDERVGSNLSRRETSIDVAVSPVGIEISPAAAARIIRLAQRISAIVAIQPLLPCYQFALAYSAFEATSVDDFSAAAVGFFKSVDLISDESSLGDTVTGAKSKSFTFWRPQPMLGYCSLGDVPNFGSGSPTRSATSIRDSLTYCSPPIGFKRVNTFKSSKSGNPSGSTLVLWQPIPSKGYRAMGLIAAYEDGGEPDPSCVRCVREGLLCESTGTMSRLFAMSENDDDDQNETKILEARAMKSKVLSVDDEKYRNYISLKPNGKRVHIWAIDSPTGIHLASSDDRNLSLDSFVDIRIPLGLAIESLETIQARKLEKKRRRRQLKKEIANERAMAVDDEDLVSVADIKLCVVTCVEFEKIWNAGDILTGYRPLPPSGFASLGDVVVDGVAHPSMTRCVEDLDHVCVKPVDFELVFESTKQSLKAAFWRPISPSKDYVSCGLVSTISVLVKPALDSVRCLSKTHCEAVEATEVTSLTKESSLIIINGSQGSVYEMCMWRTPGGFGLFCLSKAQMPNDIYNGPTLFVLPSISSLRFDDASEVVSFGFEKPKPIVKFFASIELVTLTVAAQQRIVGKSGTADEEIAEGDKDDEEDTYHARGIMDKNVPVFAISLMRTEVVANAVIGDVASVGVDASLGAAHLNWRKYAWEPVVSPQWIFGANLVPIKHGECSFATGNYLSLQATKLCITLTTAFASDIVSIAVEAQKEIMKERGNNRKQERKLKKLSTIVYQDDNNIFLTERKNSLMVKGSETDYELEMVSKEHLPREKESSLAWKERQIFFEQIQKSRDAVLRCFSNTGLTSHATLSSYNDEVESEVMVMKNDTGRTIYTISRKSLQRGKDEDIRIVPPNEKFDINFCITKKASEARKRVVETSIGDVRVAPPLEFYTAKLMIEIISIDDPFEAKRNDLERSSGVPETYSRISCAIQSQRISTTLRSMAISSRNMKHIDPQKRLPGSGEDARASLPLNAKSGYIILDAPHPISKARDFQSCNLRVDLERPCSTHDFIDDLDARSSAHGLCTHNLSLLVGHGKPKWIDLYDKEEDGTATSVRILIQASIFHTISVKVPIHLNKLGRVDAAKNVGACNVLFKRMLSSSSAVTAFEREKDEDSENSFDCSTGEGTIENFHEEEFQELQELIQEESEFVEQGNDFLNQERMMKKSLSLFSDKICSITKTYELKRIWWTKGTNAKYECSAWIPVAKKFERESFDNGCKKQDGEDSIAEVPFGCIIVPGFSAPDTGGYLARMNINDYGTTKLRKGAPFAHPIGYELLWQDEKNKSVSFWAPIPPEGYVTLGRVVMADIGSAEVQKKPSIRGFCCVREDFAREIRVIGPGAIWKPGGTKSTYGGKNKTEMPTPTIYKAGCTASGGWTLRESSKRTRSGEPREIQIKNESITKALTNNYELDFMSGRVRVKNVDVSPVLNVIKDDDNKEEEFDFEDTLIAFHKNGPFAAIKASGSDFFERKNQNVGKNEVTVDPRTGTLTSTSIFVNETTDKFSMTLVKLSHAGGLDCDKKIRRERDVNSAEDHSGRNISSLDQDYDPDDPSYRYVWESERHFPPFGWKSARDIFDACFTARFSLNIDGSNSTNYFPESDTFLLPKGYYWVNEWEIDRPPGRCRVSNTGGWAYDTYFVTNWPPSEMKNAKDWKRGFASTRRRRWKRRIAPVEEVSSSQIAQVASDDLASGSDEKDVHVDDNSQTNLLLTPRLNHRRSNNSQRSLAKEKSSTAERNEDDSWSIFAPPRGGSVYIPVGFMYNQDCAISFISENTEKRQARSLSYNEPSPNKKTRGVPSPIYNETSNFESCSYSGSEIMCESIRRRWSERSDGSASEPDVISTPENKFYLVYMEQQKRIDKNNNLRNMQIVLRAPLVFRNSLPCETKYVIYCDGQATSSGIIKPGEEAFITEGANPRCAITCAYGLASSYDAKDTKGGSWDMSDAIPISSLADGVARSVKILKKSEMNERNLEAKLLITAIEYSGISKDKIKSASKADSVDFDNTVEGLDDKGENSSISAIFVDIRTDVIVQNVCPFPIMLANEPETESNLIKMAEYQKMIEGAVESFLPNMIRRPISGFFALKPGKTNISFRAEEKKLAVNFEAGVNATVGAVDDVLKNIQKAFVKEKTIQVQQIFIADETDDHIKGFDDILELLRITGDKKIRCVATKEGVRPGEAPLLLTLRTKSRGDVRVKLVTEYWNPARSKNQNWWVNEVLFGRSIKITIVPEIVFVNISKLPLVLKRISGDETVNEDGNVLHDSSLLKIPIGSAPVLSGSTSPDYARFSLLDISVVAKSGTVLASTPRFSTYIHAEFLREFGEQLVSVPRNMMTDDGSNLPPSLLRVRSITSQRTGSTKIIIGAASKSEHKNAETAIRIENHTRMSACFSRILLKDESILQTNSKDASRRVLSKKSNMIPTKFKSGFAYDTTHFDEGVNVAPRSASLWKGPHLVSYRAKSSRENQSSEHKRRESALLPKIGQSVRIVRFAYKFEEIVDESYFEIPERSEMRDFVSNSTVGGGASSQNGGGGYGSIVLDEGLIGYDPCGENEIYYRISCIFYDGSEIGTDENIALRLTEFQILKGSADNEPDKGVALSIQPALERKPTHFNEETKDAVLSLHDADGMAAVVKGHFMSRLLHQNKRKGVRVNDYEADLKAFQRIRNVSRTAKEIHIGIIFDGIQISLIDSQQEICLFTLNGVEASFGNRCDNGNGLYAKFAISSCQIDNMLENALYPVMMFNDAKNSNLFSASFSMKQSGDINRFPEIRLIWAPDGVNIRIHEPFIWALKQFADEIGIERIFEERSNNASDTLVKRSNESDKKGVAIAKNNQKTKKVVTHNIDRLISVGTLASDGIRAYVTLTSAPSSRPKDAPMIVCATLNVLRLDRLPITIAPFSLPTNASLKLSELKKKMQTHVIRQFTIQSGRILASVDTAGSVSVGLRRAQDALHELSGDSSRNIVSSREKGATTSVAEGVKNIGQGYVDGTMNLVGGALSGVAGVFYKPVQGFRQEGLRGAAIGGIKGIAGLVTQTLGGAVGLVETTFSGISQAISVTGILSKSAGSLDANRARMPLALRGDGIVRSYDEDQAAGAEILRTAAKKIAYTEEAVKQSRARKNRRKGVRFGKGKKNENGKRRSGNNDDVIIPHKIYKGPFSFGRFEVLQPLAHVQDVIICLTHTHLVWIEQVKTDPTATRFLRWHEIASIYISSIVGRKTVCVQIGVCDSLREESMVTVHDYGFTSALITAVKKSAGRGGRRENKPMNPNDFRCSTQLISFDSTEKAQNVLLQMRTLWENAVKNTRLTHGFNTEPILLFP